MGKRLRKQELLSEIRRERRLLDDALALLSVRQMTKAGVTRGGWSVKDVLAHLVEWQQMNLDWYAAGLRGETPAIPAPAAPAAGAKAGAPSRASHPSRVR